MKMAIITLLIIAILSTVVIDHAAAQGRTPYRPTRTTQTTTQQRTPVPTPCPPGRCVQPATGLRKTPLPYTTPVQNRYNRPTPVPTAITRRAR